MIRRTVAVLALMAMAMFAPVVLASDAAVAEGMSDAKLNYYAFAALGCAIGMDRGTAGKRRVDRAASGKVGQAPDKIIIIHLHWLDDSLIRSLWQLELIYV